MKINLLFISVLAGFSLGAAQGAYDFRRELETVHRPDRRDAAARCTADEFAFADGARIALVGKASACVPVARDYVPTDDKAAVRAIAREEYANAKAALPLVEENSRLGWEPSMEYVGGPRQIRWKLRLMQDLYGLAGD